MLKSCGIVFFALLFVCILSTSYQSPALADATTVGKELFASCSSCHSPGKRDLAGQDAKILVEKFNALQNGNFTSGAKKKMKDLFMKMSDSDKTALAQYIQNM